MPWHKRLICMTSVAMALCSTPAVRAEEPKPTISVSGSAEIRVAPDEVVITAAVESRAKEAATACKDNEASIRSIVQFLKASGVEDKHISTRYISIEPIMPRPEYSGKGNRQAQQNQDPFGPGDEDQLQTPVGYLARRQFAITIVNLDKFEDIYLGLIEHGINRVMGTDFRTSKLREHRDEARLKAVRAAKEKATAMAGELGANLKAIKSIQETAATYSNSSLMVQNSVSDPFAASSGYGASAEEVAVGQITITASVDVVFYLGNTEQDK